MFQEQKANKMWPGKGFAGLPTFGQLRDSVIMRECGMRLNLPLVPVLSWCCGTVGGSQWADVLVFVTVKNT